MLSLAALARNKRLDDAEGRGAAADAAFDLADVLKRHVAAQTIVAFRVPSNCFPAGFHLERHRTAHRCCGDSPRSIAPARGCSTSCSRCCCSASACTSRASSCMSGLTKIHDWSVTLALFTDEYHVPLLPPAVAAALGTATELSMPVLLALGLGSRFAAGVLFIFNIVAVISYSALPDIAVKDHILWGTMLLVLTVCGPGKIALDHWLERRLSAGSGDRGASA